MKTKKITADLDEIIPHLIGVWRRFHKLSGPGDVLQTREFRSVVENVIKIQNGFDFGKDYFEDRDLVGSYLLYQWVLHYQQGLSLIQEIPFTPNRVLDICAGPCAFSFAALKLGATDVTAVDRSLTALNLGAEACGRWGFPLSIRKWTYGKEKLPVEGKFDLIIVGYCLEELFPPSETGFLAKREAWIKELLKLLSPHGQILIVDSSANEINRQLLRLRDLMVKDGVPIQAPCILWQGECPALASEAPCYAQREMEKPYLIKEIQRAAQINLSSLKMSYLILRNPLSGQVNTLDRNLYRVISPPVDTYHGKRYYLCGTDGGKKLESHLKEHPKESRAFDYLRRGEVISFQNALESQHSIDVVKDTIIKIEAACGKPLPYFKNSEDGSQNSGDH